MQFRFFFFFFLLPPFLCYFFYFFYFFSGPSREHLKFADSPCARYWNRFILYPLYTPYLHAGGALFFPSSFFSLSLSLFFSFFLTNSTGATIKVVCDLYATFHPAREIWKYLSTAARSNMRSYFVFFFPACTVKQWSTQMARILPKRTDTDTGYAYVLSPNRKYTLWYEIYIIRQKIWRYIALVRYAKRCSDKLALVISRNKYPSMRQVESAESNDESVFHLEQSCGHPGPIGTSRGHQECDNRAALIASRSCRLAVNQPFLPQRQ